MTSWGNRNVPTITSMAAIVQALNVQEDSRIPPSLACGS
jgi:hypothetical protein